MQNIRIRFVIILSSVALVGLILTQLFWVVNALRLSEKQFDHRVDMAFDDVMEELMIAFFGANGVLASPFWFTLEGAPWCR